MTCATCRHAIQHAVRENEITWRVELICCEDIDHVRAVAASYQCDAYEREPGADLCDQMGRGDAGNWN